MNVELHATIDPIAAEWEALADRTESSPFDGPGWIAAWWNAFGTGNLEVLAVRDGGELAAVLPLVRRAGGLYLPTNTHTPSFAPVGTPEGIATAYDAAFATRPAYFRARFAAHGCTHSRQCPRSRLHGDRARPEQLRRTSPSRPMRRVQGPRAPRRLLRHADVELEVHDCADDLNDALRRVIDLEGSGWKTSLGTAIASEEATLRVYTDIAVWAAARGMLRLAFLRVDGSAVAADFVLVKGRSTYDLKGGYDPAYRTFSPGLVLQGLLIEWARDQGYATHELLGAADQWKLEWTQQMRPRYDVVAIGGGFGGRIACSVLTQALPIVRTAGSGINRLWTTRARVRR